MSSSIFRTWNAAVCGMLFRVRLFRGTHAFKCFRNEARPVSRKRFSGGSANEQSSFGDKCGVDRSWRLACNSQHTSTGLVSRDTNSSWITVFQSVFRLTFQGVRECIHSRPPPLEQDKVDMIGNPGFFTPSDTGGSWQKSKPQRVETSDLRRGRRFFRAVYDNPHARSWSRGRLWRILATQ